jgi:DNA ligase (NAD+)
MHASSCFQILGTKKLKLVEHLYDTNPSLEDLTAIKGYSVRSAQAYLKGVELFQKFVAELPNVTIKLASDSGSNKCDGMIVVFTGIRRKDLEEKIEEQGGKVTTSVSKKTTHLIMKQEGSGSTKEQKALTFGTTIWDVDKLVDFLEKDFN